MGITHQTQLIRYLVHQIPKEPDAAYRSPNSHISAVLPCYYIPYPPHSQLFGRASIMAEIEEILDHSVPLEGLRSAALWAEAEIGKTQITLEYTNRRWRDSLEAVF